MKRLIIFILALAAARMVAGCGKNYVDSGDTESLYPYSWCVNSDQSVTFKIDGQWDKECAWRAEYDEEVLACEVGKKGNTFTFKALQAQGTTLDLRLYRGDGTAYEYDLSFYVQGDSFGGISVLENAHVVPLQEGNYSYANDDAGRMMFRIDTNHYWNCRTVYPGIFVNVSENGGDYLVFGIEADPNAQGTVELYDDEGSLLYEVDVIADSDGRVLVSDVREKNDTAFSKGTLAVLWEQLGFAPLLPDSVEIVNGRIRTDEEYPFLCGDLKLVIDGDIYDYSTSMSYEWIMDYYVRDEVDEKTGELIPGVAPEHIDVNGIDVSLFAREERCEAVWQDYGVSFALEGWYDRNTFMSALNELLGG